MKEEHLHTSDHKLQHLGYGEWVEEPDKVEFTYKGYECLVWRIYGEEPFAPQHWYGGFLCGYVRIPEDHFAYKKHYDHIDIDCHGGLTYGDFREGREEEGYFIGFDCAHSQDYNPSMEFFRSTHDIAKRIFPIPEEFKKYAIFNPTYRNVDFVKKECRSIVRQLINMNAMAKIKEQIKQEAESKE